MMRLIEAEDAGLMDQSVHHKLQKKHHKNHTDGNETQTNSTVEPEPEPVLPAECTAKEESPKNTKKTFDSSLHFHTDYTRSVVAQVGSDPEPFHLIPDTAMSQIILLNDKCQGCYTLGDRHAYTATCPSPSGNFTADIAI